MGSTRGPGSVRPLGSRVRPDRETTPPRLYLVIALLAVGGLVGWIGATLGGNSPAAVDDSTPHAPTTSPVLLAQGYEVDQATSIDWVESSEVPIISPGWELADHSDVVEVDGSTYMVIGLRRDRETSNELWSSTDGYAWAAHPLRFGTPAANPRLAATSHGLLLTVATESGDVLWRADVSSGDDLVWRRVSLPVPEGLSNPVIAMAVADDGDTVALLTGDTDLWRNVIEPFVPEGIDVEDPTLSYDGGEFLSGAGSETEVRLFAEPPQVLITEQLAWVRIVTPDGEEAMATAQLPPGTYPLSASPRLSDIQLFTTRVSSDGETFVPAEGPSAMPRFCFRPIPLGDGFIARINEPDSADAKHGTVLWTSDTGVDWQRDPIQPPGICSPFSLAVSGETLHLTSDSGTQCRRGPDSEWVVLDEPCTSCYKVGGTAGFVGYPRNFAYDRGMFSSDGISWSEIAVPGFEPYPTLAILEDDLLAISVSDEDPNHCTRIRIWRGTIGSV